jgi:hypothetical protein
MGDLELRALAAKIAVELGDGWEPDPRRHGEATARRRWLAGWLATSSWASSRDLDCQAGIGAADDATASAAGVNPWCWRGDATDP